MYPRIRSSSPRRGEVVQWVIVGLLLLSLYFGFRRPTEVYHPCRDQSKDGAPSPVAGNVGKDVFGREVEKFVFTKIDMDESYVARLKAREKWPSSMWEELLVQNAKLNALNEEGFVIIALANIGMKEMTMNWIASLLRNKYSKFLVICFDFQIYMFLCEYGFDANVAMVPRGWLHKDIDASFKGWLSQGYKDLLHGKILIMIELWKRKIPIFYNDVDLVFLSDKVFDHIMLETALYNPDFTYMVDGVDIDGVVYMNGGFWLARPTQSMIDIFRRVYQISTTRPEHVIDQSALNYVMQIEFQEVKRDYKRFTALSKALYPNGLYISQEDWNAKLGIYPLVAHFNYMVGNAPKKAEMKRLNMWYVGETFAD